MSLLGVILVVLRMIHFISQVILHC